MPRDSLFPTCLSFLSVVAFVVDDTDAAAALLPHVERYRGQILTISGWLVALGSADRLEAMLLTVLGRYDEAELRFESARALERRVGSEPFVAAPTWPTPSCCCTAAGPETTSGLGRSSGAPTPARARLGLEGLRRHVAERLSGGAGG